MPVQVERPAVRRLRVRGWLRTLSPLHVGGAGHDPNGPLSVAVDGQGRLYVPGSGLTGALRTLLRSGHSAEEHDTLWGYAKPGTREAAASRFVVHDALICAEPALDGTGDPASLLDPAQVETRFSVGIDRVRGTAAHGFLHARALVPRNSFLRFELDLSGGTRDSREDDEREIRRLLAVLSDRRLRLGAAKTRGLGRVTLVPELTEVDEQDLTSAEGLFDVLRGGGRKLDLLGDRDGQERHQEEDTQLPPFLDIEIAWRPLTPVMVRAATSGFVLDAVPLTSAVSSETVSPVLPGSALKGVLRSHAERIERTARRLDAPSDISETSGTSETSGAPDASGTSDVSAPERSATFRRQLTQLPAVNALFGTAPRSRRQQEDTGTQQVPEDQVPAGSGAVTVDDCFAKPEIPADLWAGLHEPETAPRDAKTLLETLGEKAGMRRADHVAIDRWTGGAADGLLFSVLEPHGLEWEPITLTVDLARLTRLGRRQHEDRPLGDAAEALLLLTLRDLQAGRIRLGFASNRGMGDIQVTSITLKRSGPHSQKTSLNDLLATGRAAELTAAWQSYLDNGSPA